MTDSQEIVRQDEVIGKILDQAPGRAASLLFERYRIAGDAEEAFVAALIGRVCLAHRWPQKGDKR